ncbi:membrane protein [Nocardia sp. NRRL S-836]|nr:membrane protein [Nocardia sp. NRRL S-836]
MTSGKKTKATRNSVAAARSSVVGKKPKPWGTIIAVVAVLGLAGGVFGYAYSQIHAQNVKEAALAKWKPSDTNKDPSTQLAGIVVKEYKGSRHVEATQRVAYDQTPAFGGPHDGQWADCTGVVYDKAVRTENMVHGLEHGAVWIAYNPDQVSGDALGKLKTKVEGIPYMMMSPYPGLDKPISLQAWGHQLKVDNADDERIDQFVSSLLRNSNTYPEVGASCENSAFLSNPAPFVAEKPGADAVPMDGGKDDSATEGQPNASTPPPSGSVSTPPSS